MFLAIDIGNTNIKLALFKGNRIYRSWRIITDKAGGIKHYKRLLTRLLAQRHLRRFRLEKIIICSVVPGLTKIFVKVLISLFATRPLILGKDIIAPIKNHYRRPQQVGQDRLANAVAAFSRYGGPVVVVDFGTAVTFDLVSAKGIYLGGIIVPGIELALKALISNADLLPEVVLTRPREFLGRDTASSIKSGIIYGYSFLIEGILQHLKKRFRHRPQIIATGGKAGLMLGYCRSISRVEPNLTLQGLIACLKKSK